MLQGNLGIISLSSTKALYIPTLIINKDWTKLRLENREKEIKEWTTDTAVGDTGIVFDEYHKIPGTEGVVVSNISALTYSKDR